jgi:hypothetical protein
MADKAVPYGAAAIFGAVTGWKYVGPGSSSINKDLAEAKDELGNVAASNLINERIDKSANLECYDDTNTVPANIGEVVNSIALTGISITLNKNAAARMTLTGHNHTANAHTATNLAAHGIEISAAFGAEDLLGGTAGDNAAVESVQVNITCDHTDEADEGGEDHFCGQNHNAKIQVTQTWLGVPTTAFDSATWQGTATETTDVNSGFTRTVVNVTKYLTLAAPTPP